MNHFIHPFQNMKPKNFPGGLFFVFVDFSLSHFCYKESSLLKVPFTGSLSFLTAEKFLYLYKSQTSLKIKGNFYILSCGWTFACHLPQYSIQCRRAPGYKECIRRFHLAIFFFIQFFCFLFLTWNLLDLCRF